MGSVQRPWVSARKHQRLSAPILTALALTVLPTCESAALNSRSTPLNLRLSCCGAVMTLHHSCAHDATHCKQIFASHARWICFLRGVWRKKYVELISRGYKKLMKHVLLDWRFVAKQAPSAGRVNRTLIAAKLQRPLPSTPITERNRVIQQFCGSVCNQWNCLLAKHSRTDVGDVSCTRKRAFPAMSEGCTVNMGGIYWSLEPTQEISVTAAHHSPYISFIICVRPDWRRRR